MNATAPQRLNVGGYLARLARERGENTALRVPERGDWRSLTGSELDALCDRCAHGLARLGLARGDRVCVFVRPGVEWVALVYALWKLGAVPVLIDPGMGRRAVLSCVERMRPRGFLGIPLAHALRLLSPAAFRTVELAVTVGAPKLWSGPSFSALVRNASREPFEPAPTGPDDPAAILFTSGSTGPAKGVAYTHGMFAAQVEALRELYDMRPGDVDLACFAPFALFGAALQLETVLADIDFSRPARCDPARIAGAIAQHGCVQTFGSPAIWRRVIPWCLERGRRLEPLRRLMIAGAPVSPALVDDCLSVLSPEGEVHTPYGATESLPVASIAGREILSLRERTEGGEGNCVGRPAPGIELRVIRIEDGPIEVWDDSLEVAPGELGELVVRGPVVTRSYQFEPEATRRAKIPATGPDGHGEPGGQGEPRDVYHRLGDAGRVDEQGRIWFQGRLSQRLETARGLRLPVGIENVFNTHPAVRRSALVGVGERGAQRPVLVVEPEPELAPRGADEERELASGILAVGRRFEPCSEVERVLFKDSLPVDVRHNAKIRREELALWATRELA